MPTGLAEMPPGPGLAATLAGLDLARVPDELTVTVLQAQYRQVAHEQARLLQAIVEMGRCTPLSDPDDPFLRAMHGVARLRAVQEWASGELAAALTLTGVAADRELALAVTVVTRLPEVHAALSAGAIDLPKTRMFAEHLDGDLTAEQVETICEALLAVAPGLTTGQLRARLVRMIHDIDPAHARRRYHRAVRDRAVVGYLRPDGTVTVSATGLPAGEAAVACERLDVLAAAAQRAGHAGRAAQIQADLFLGMLDGSFHHLSEAQIIAVLLGRARPEGGGQSDPDRGAGQAPAARRGAGGTVRTGVEIRVGLRTLIGLDERCGEVPGLGPVLPDVARRLVAAQHRGAQWRFAVVDPGGHLVVAGTTRCRPAGGGYRLCRGGVVEIHVAVDELARLADDPAGCGRWASVVADIARGYADRADTLARLDSRPGDRFAHAGLVRHVEVRDRTCCFPGCRRPARRSDKDHTRDHARRGPTTRANLAPLCDRHHRDKTERGWTLAQPEPGRFRWTSPLGRSYRTRGEPIRPPSVPPCPRPVEPDAGAERYVSGPVLMAHVPRRHTPPPRGRGPDSGDEPPF